MRILCIESVLPSISQAVASLEKYSMIVDKVYSIQEVLELARTYDYDLIMLSPSNDFKLCSQIVKKIRYTGLDVPLLILEQQTDIREKLACFENGADDYLICPFDHRELIARIYAIVRRFKGHSDSVIRVSDFEINFNTKNVTVGGKKLSLTAKEYALVELLALRKGTILHKEQFLNHLYGGIDEPEIKIIDVFLCKIRRKIKKLSGGKQYIRTVWGRGYVLKEEESN